MKILYFGNCSPGAMGIIHRDIKKIIDAKYPEIQFDLLDWSINENYQLFFYQSIWKNYDILLVDPYIARCVTELGECGVACWLVGSKDYKLFKSKLIPVYHSEVDVPADHFNHGWYEGWFTTPICGINPYIVDQIKARGADSQLLPVGVSREKFKPFKEVKKIKKIGFVGNAFQEGAEDWKSIKRPELFKEICNNAGIECVPIFGKENNLDMYEDIDAIICSSTAEGLPTYFAEVVACKIPFISTKVGIVRYYDKVKTFNTVGEAVDIINYLNESEDNIETYVNELHDQMFPDRDWENILAKYWIPYFKELVNKNNMFIQTIPGKHEVLCYSSVHKKYIDNPGAIVDIGCLGWDWSNMFLGNHRVIGADPQEIHIPHNAELFKGLIGPFDGLARLEETGIDAGVSNNGMGNWHDVLSWKSFCERFNIREIAILKINIEGGEYPLLQSMDSNDFAKIDQIAVSFHDWLYPEQYNQKISALKLLESNGFNIIEASQTRPSLKNSNPWGWYLAYKDNAILS
jgi:hypothetical protein